MQPKNSSDVTVLVVDDDEIDVMGVQRAFEKSKLRNPIIVASDGGDALRKLRDGKSVPRPYLVLLDINMPRMSGIEFLENARQDPDLHNSVIFVLTTSNDENDKRKVYRHNVAGYIVKGYQEDGFVDAVSLLDQYSRINQFPM